MSGKNTAFSWNSAVQLRLRVGIIHKKPKEGGISAVGGTGSIYTFYGTLPFLQEDAGNTESLDEFGFKVLCFVYWMFFSQRLLMCFLMVMVLLQLKVAKCDIWLFFLNLGIYTYQRFAMRWFSCPKRQWHDIQFGTQVWRLGQLHRCCSSNPQFCCKKNLLIPRWWFQTFFIFTPIWGRFPIWLIFSNGLKPPTRYSVHFKFALVDSSILCQTPTYLLLQDHCWTKRS